MNILALDYGTKNIGLAWVSTSLSVVLPYGQINNNKTRNQELSKLVKEEKIDMLVVGLPLGLDGKENANTKRVREFVEDVKKTIKIPVEFFDERFSSAEADRFEGSGASRDEKAAMIILQSYIDHKKAA